MYARSLTTRQISDQSEEIYGFECSEGLISDVTDKVMQEIDDWQKCLLDEIYPIVFIDAVHFSVRDDNRIRKLAAYIIPAYTLDGHKDVIGLEIGEKYMENFPLCMMEECHIKYAL